MRVGFTGTQRGMTKAQLDVVRLRLRAFAPALTEAHHGDCVGADAEFHAIAFAETDAVIHVHPPSRDDRRAWCGWSRDELPRVVIHECKDYLERDRDVANAVDVLLAAPDGFRPRVRSGTWYTVRYARSVPVPARVVVWPDGSTTEEEEESS